MATEKRAKGLMPPGNKDGNSLLSSAAPPPPPPPPPPRHPLSTAATTLHSPDGGHSDFFGYDRSGVAAPATMTASEWGGSADGKIELARTNPLHDKGGALNRFKRAGKTVQAGNRMAAVTLPTEDDHISPAVQRIKRLLTTEHGERTLRKEIGVAYDMMMSSQDNFLKQLLKFTRVGVITGLLAPYVDAWVAQMMDSVKTTRETDSSSNEYTHFNDDSTKASVARAYDVAGIAAGVGAVGYAGYKLYTTRKYAKDREAFVNATVDQWSESGHTTLTDDMKKALVAIRLPEFYQKMVADPKIAKTEYNTKIAGHILSYMKSPLAELKSTDVVLVLASIFGGFSLASYSPASIGIGLGFGLAGLLNPLAGVKGFEVDTKNSPGASDVRAASIEFCGARDDLSAERAKVDEADPDEIKYLERDMSKAQRKVPVVMSPELMAELQKLEKDPANRSLYRQVTGWVHDRVCDTFGWREKVSSESARAGAVTAMHVDAESGSTARRASTRVRATPTPPEGGAAATVLHMDGPRARAIRALQMGGGSAAKAGHEV